MSAGRPFDYRVPAIAGCALFMELLDATAVLTALPQMAEDFGEPALRMNLVVSLYLLAAAVFVPASGWAADRFGPRQVFVAAIGLFTCASLACALSASLLQLSLARLAQGAGGAMMVPVGQVILLRWSSRDNLLRAMAFLTAPALLGPVIGPPLGGLLVTFASWHWIFLINLPIGLLGLWLVWRFIPDYPPGEAGRLDGKGLLLSAGGLACLVFAFEALGHGLLAPLPIAALLLAGMVFAWLYVGHARRCERPLIDLTLLRIPTFSIAIWGGNLFRLGSGALPFLLVLLFQLGFGLSPLTAGLLTFAGGAGALAIKFLAAPIVQRFGFRQTLVGNALLGGLSVAVCAVFRADTPYWLVIGLLFLGGLARSLQMSTLGALTYADVPPALSSRASSLAAMSMQLSLSLSVGLAATFLGLVQRWRGHGQVTVDDITLVLLFCGVICGSSLLLFRRLRGGAGAGLYKVSERQ
ncbi:MFS transporter [Pseudomonas brassicacearum]|jgi:EmrB/QacA subfamily drug resistance transporter|uniref:MFS transporter n=1 Tax=Pseudomonas brassicacearum TaxID=930166 RepID=A0A423JT84_9PSED|nr:MFS transporter [Pseudomonas brassicacearum]RON40916.1 MFS transporter [Pseudomonas brassicacearum]